MSKRRMRTMVVLVLALFVSYASAVEILWDEPVPITSADDLIMLETSGLVHAGSWGHSGNGTVEVEIGGEIVVFNGTNDAELSRNGNGTNADATGNGQTQQGGAFPGDTGIPELNNILDSFCYDGANPKVVTINGLSVGQPYKLQLITCDNRSCCGNRTQFWSDNATKGAGNESTSFRHGDCVAVTGNFIADAETIQVYGHGDAQNQTIISAYQLRLAGKREIAAVVTPGDGDQDLERDGVVLEWSPGAFAVESDIYLGIDFDEVNDATVDSAVYVERTTDTAYALDRLTLGETYFWRIDGINDANANSPWKGDVWTFEIEPAGYPVDVALLTTSASGNIGAEPNVVTNGAGLSADGTHDTDSENNMWMTGAATPGEGWLQIDMNEPAKLAGLHIWNHNSTNEKGPITALHMGVKDVLIEYSLDGDTWVSAGEVTLAQAPGSADYKGEMVSLGNVYAKSVKLTIQSGYGLLGFSGLSEVQLLAVPTAAREMTPAEGATVNPMDVVLSWRAGRDVDTHQVYISSDVNAVLEETAPMIEVTEPMLVPNVAMDMTYYWKVVEVNDLETLSRWAGPVQSFVTVANLVIDDMESYPTDDGLQIWQAWADGYENDNQDNGSIVGDATGLPETTIVYQGAQSLNMQYGVNSQPDSWATHTFESTEDWSLYGIQSLSLKFFGASTNELGELYVLVNDTRYAYASDMTDIKAGQWHTFTIDLDGVTDVQTITIGVKGGTGQLYVDDIRLYPLPSELITPVAPDAAGLQVNYQFEGDFNDSSGQGNHGTALGDAKIVTDSIRGQVLSLDGFDDGVEVPLVGISNETTIAMWMNVVDDPTVVQYNAAFHSHGWEPNAVHMRLQYGKIGGDVNGTAAVIGPSAIGANEWVHVAYTLAATETTSIGSVWLNGVRENTRMFTVDPEVGQRTVWVGNGLVGAWRNASGAIQRGTMGTIDDVQIYDRALSAAEIAGAAGRTEPLYKPLP